jgi:DNA-binding CsgD family transcriptional regulator
MHASENTVVSVADARAIVGLLSEVIAAPDDLTAKRRILMEGISRLTEADFWAWCMIAWSDRPNEPAFVKSITGGILEGRHTALFQAWEHPSMGVIHAEIIKALDGPYSHVTRTRAGFDPDDRVGFKNPEGVWAKADVSDLIASYRNVDEKTAGSIGLYRRPGRPDFDAREVRIAHILLTEVPWLYERSDDRHHPDAIVPDLSRRERTVLFGLMNGDAPNAIAETLQISSHTVNDYIKSVYRHFGVNSRAQLLGKFTRGDGGDRV